VRYTYILLYPLVLLATYLAPEILGLWLGDDFARNGTAVLRWLAVGVLINNVAAIPWTFVQAAARPDLAAKLHLVELPLYIGALVLLLGGRGIEGVAIAWTLRATVDLIAFAYFTRRLLPIGSQSGQMIVVIGISIPVLVLAALFPPFAIRGILLALALPSFLLVAWFVLLEPNDRALAAGRIGALRRALGGLR
jgi:O-antigen/teichoic acid export membrane protein